MERIRLASGSRFSLFRADLPSYRHLLRLAGPGRILAVVHAVRRRRWLYYAIVAVLAFSTVSLLFVFARFSFGYFIGFSLFTMVLGFIWLNSFSKFNYDHRLAGLSAAASAVLFLLPALLINAPVKQTFALSPRALEHLLKFILLLALGTIVAASFYNFRLVSIRQIYDFPTFHFSISISTLSQRSPFSGADTLPDRNCVHGAAAVRLRLLSGAQSPLVGWPCRSFLMLLFYPITLSKFALFSAAWMVVVADAFEDFRAQSRSHPVDPAADACSA